jgi:Ala-tRNA(Pro) deacylase
MTLTEKIQLLLDQNQIEYKLSHHEYVRTSEEAAKVRGSDLSQGAKALIFWADSSPIQIVIQGNQKVDKEKFKTLFGYSKLKMVSADELKQISSVEPGAVPPFGNLFEPSIKVFCNAGFGDIIEFNAGDHRVSIQMKYKDWLDLVDPSVGDYGEGTQIKK